MSHDAEPEQKLCEACQRFDVRSLLIASQAIGPPAPVAKQREVHDAIPNFYAHLPNLSSLNESRKGCNLCAGIWQQFSERAQPWELEPEALEKDAALLPIFFGATLWDRLLNGSPTISVSQIGLNGKARSLAAFDAFADRSSIPPDIEGNYILGRSTGENSGSEGCLSAAKGMLDDCLRTHTKCNRARKFNGRMPTRILRLDTEQPRARLVDGSGMLEPFVALSYCWGGESTLTLTSSSEERLRHGISFDDFPRTMKDALLVTQSLGYHYLWIDALCIHQDSAEDWTRESGRMRGVYKGAILTIDAASALKPSIGIFRDRAALRFRCRIQWHNGQSPVPHVYLRSALEWSDTTTIASATDKRAWTLQEGLLAPRTLRFGLEQIAFICAEGAIDEAGRRTVSKEIYSNKAVLQQMYHETHFWRQARKYSRRFGMPTVVSVPYYELVNIWRGFEVDYKSYMFVKRYSQWVLQRLSTTPGGQRMTFYDQWRAIVRWYTRRSLSYESDVLPALAGLAEEFHQITGGDEYIAGMWKGDLVNSLDWSRLPNAEESSKVEIHGPKEYLAPSWSWASVFGKHLAFPSTGDYEQSKYLVTSKIKILDVQMETEGDGPFGRVRSGLLSLRGPVLDISSPLEAVELDHRLPATHAELINTYKGSIRENYEFYQQHRPHVGQKFALLHLSSHKDRLDTRRVDNYLLLETASESEWRRVDRLRFARTGEFEKQLARKRGWYPFPEDKVNVRLELTNAAWESRVLHMV